MNRFSTGHLPLLFALSLPLVLLWRLWLGGQVLFWGVPLTQFYAWHTLVKESLLNGHLPLWNFYLGNGTPLLANHQSGVFYPPNLLYLILPVERAMGYLVIVHLMLAALFAYLWGRTIGLAPFGRAILALSYALGGVLVGRTQFLPMIYAAAWLPLLFSLAHRLRHARRPKVTGAAWLGLVIGLQFLAGHAQWWFYSLVAMGLYYLILLILPTGPDWSASISPPLRGEKPSDNLSGRSRKSPGAIIKFLFYLALAGIIGLGLAAAQLLPTLELAFNSQRSAGADYTFAMTYSMWPWRWLTLLIPNLFGSPATGDYGGYATYWEDATYLGIIPLLFAVSALLGWVWAQGRKESIRHTPLSLVPFFFLLACLGSWLAMGQNTALYPWIFEHVPGFGFFQAPARLLLWTSFALATLAGIGADRFRLSCPAQYALRLPVAGGIAILITGLYLGQSGLLPRASLAAAVVEFALWLILGAVALLLRGRDADSADSRVAHSPLNVGSWQWLVLVVAAADLLRFGQPLSPTIEPSLYQTPIQSARFLQTQNLARRIYASEQYDYDLKFGRYFSFRAFGDNDLTHWQGLRESLLPTFPAVVGLRSANNYDPLGIGRWRHWLDVLQAAPWPERERLLRLANVGYLLGQGPPGSSAIYSNTIAIYELPDPLPEAYVISGVRPAADEREALTLLTDPDFDPKREVILEGRPPVPADEPLHPAISIDYEANRLVIHTDAPNAGYLVVSQTYHPGWQATVDDGPAPILPANATFQTVPVPAGEHTVILSYRPASFTWGATLSLLSLIGLALAALYQSWRI